MINFSLKNDGPIDLSIYNIKGQLVKNLYTDFIESGFHAIEWDGKDNSGNTASTGIYFYKLQTSDFVSARKMIMMK